ncbi:substrate-binding domain-containing protein [Treponema primitia]|uniref:substrate-binding domain-containing protein n=1 Tax=Treponema primitia TaxID=88058 RepID=UPI00397EB46B
MKKSLCVFMVVLMVVSGLFLAGCQKKEAAGPQKISIAFARSESNDTWLSYLHDAFAAEFASKPEYEIIWSDGQNDVTRQQDNVNAAIAQGVKAIVVVPVDTSAAAPMIRAAQEAKIPIIFVNRNPFVGSTPPAGVYYCGSDSVVAGRQQMEYLGEQMGGSGEIAILMGQLNQEAAQDRTRGVKQIITEKYPNIKVVGEQTGNWMRNEGVNVTENWLTAYPNLKAIASNNDEMAMGALVAIASTGRTGILVGGTDGNPDAVQAVKDGKMACSVLQNAKGQGAGAADFAIRALKGEKLDPVKWVPYELITPKNVNDYL